MSCLTVNKHHVTSTVTLNLLWAHQISFLARQKKKRQCIFWYLIQFHQKYKRDSF